MSKLSALFHSPLALTIPTIISVICVISGPFSVCPLITLITLITRITPASFSHRADTPQACRLFNNGISDRNAVYRQSLVKLPRPEFIVLYNGGAGYPDAERCNSQE